MTSATSAPFEARSAASPSCTAVVGLEQRGGVDPAVAQRPAAWHRQALGVELADLLHRTEPFGHLVEPDLTADGVVGEPRCGGRSHPGRMQTRAIRAIYRRSERGAGRALHTQLGDVHTPRRGSRRPTRRGRRRGVRPVGPSATLDTSDHVCATASDGQHADPHAGRLDPELPGERLHAGLRDRVVRAAAGTVRRGLGRREEHDLSVRAGQRSEQPLGQEVGATHVQQVVLVEAPRPSRSRSSPAPAGPRRARAGRRDGRCGRRTRPRTTPRPRSRGRSAQHERAHVRSELVEGVAQLVRVVAHETDVGTPRAELGRHGRAEQTGPAGDHRELALQRTPGATRRPSHDPGLRRRCPPARRTTVASVRRRAARTRCSGCRSPRPHRSGGSGVQFPVGTGPSGLSRSAVRSGPAGRQGDDRGDSPT